MRNGRRAADQNGDGAMTAAKIADLNDHLRRTFTGGRVMMKRWIDKTGF